MQKKSEIKMQIELLREELNSNLNSIDDLKGNHIINLSQSLDDLIIEYYEFCKNNLLQR